MTFINDLCDFCGGYCDPIGCDTKRSMLKDGTMWCGQCEPGRIFWFRMFDSEQLQHLMDAAQQDTNASGITYEDRGDDHRAWWKFLDNESLIYNAKIELERRG